MEPFEKIEFIRNIHLFRGLSEEELNTIARQLSEKTYPAGQTIILEKTDGDYLYLLYKGKVSVTRTTRRGEQHLADLVAGDHFGEEALLRHKRRTATVKAVEETKVLVLSQENLNELLKKIPNLVRKFEIAIASHQLTRRMHFTWLEKGEVVYFICRKHSVLLWQSLAAPVLGLLLPVLSLILFLLYPEPFFLWTAGLILLALFIIILFKWLDWGNDYYIVTNRRVLYLEKVILMYDSRQEAPLTAVLSVNTQSDMVGRTLGYGDVIVRTFVGKIVFKTIAHPDEVELLVREYWERTRRSVRQADSDAMNLAIRRKLGLAPPSPPVETPKPATKPALKFNYFKIRFEERGIITYRKHWVVWLKQTWVPGLLILVGLGVIINSFFVHGLVGNQQLLPRIVLGLLVPTFGWWLYETVDWSNDKFQVSEEQILDIDRKPLGREQKNIAPLDNILAMEFHREGLLQMLFNYGSVHITVGGSKMVFEDVMNPAEVQQDIDQRRVARKEKQERERQINDRERLADYFADSIRKMPALQAELAAKAAPEQPKTTTPANPTTKKK